MRIEKGRFWEKVQQAEASEVVNNLSGSLYAVLFNADLGHLSASSHDVRLVYHSLIDAGVANSKIAILDGDGITQKDYTSYVNQYFSATSKSLEMIIDSIRQTAKPNDRLLVYVTGHGDIVDGQCVVAAYDGIISENIFGQMVQDLPVNFGLFYFAQCCSYGFAERMGYGRNIGMSNTSRRTEMPNASPVRESYGRALLGIGANFTHFLFPKILNPDISIEEAFDHAVQEDTNLLLEDIEMDPKSYEIPQLRWQNANPSRLCLAHNLIPLPIPSETVDSIRRKYVVD